MTTKVGTEVKFGDAPKHFFWYSATHYGFLKVQNGSQWVSAAWPDWSEARGGLHRRKRVSGHLLVQTQLLQRREPFAQHRHGRTHCAGLLSSKACGTRRRNMWCCGTKTQRGVGGGQRASGVTCLQSWGSDPTGWLWSARCWRQLVLHGR